MASKKKDEASVKFTADTQEFNDEIKKSENQMKEYRSELRLNSEMMKTVGQSADLLQQKQDILTKEYEASESKVQALSSKLKIAAETFGETSEEASKLRIQLNNAKVAQEKIQQAINQTTQDIEDYKVQMDQAADETNNLEQESKQAGEETDRFNDRLRESADEAKNASGSYTVMKGTLSQLAADGIEAAGDALKDFIEDSQTASSSFQAMTGSSKAEMAEFNDELEKIYKEGYGESLNDVGDAMAYVKQTMSDLEPEVISEISENAIVLDDVFGIDVTESIGAVKTLMQIMGLDAETAFDYIAKGAQNGLNYSNELADNIKEYGPLWDQAGFSAEEMFAILQNGVDSGAYNLDKINDFVKEFTISLADGRIEENLDSFSEGTQDLFKEWKDGKKTAKDVFESVIDDLKNAEDQQTALTTASEVWSSLGEDNAMTIITSLNDVNDKYKDVYGTIEEIKDVKYDNVVNEYKKLGRSIETDIFQPLAEKALPAAEEFVDFTSENLDKIIPLAQGLGTAMAGIFVVDKVTEFATALGSLATPVTAIIGVTTLLTGAIVAMDQAQQQAIEDTWGLTEEQKKHIEESQKTIEVYDQLVEKRSAQTESINAEYDYINKLNQELGTLVDENGYVKESYEGRVQFIVNQLAEATGMEIEYIDGQIKGYQNLRSEIEQTIEIKRAEAILGAYQSSYVTALQEAESAQLEYKQSLQDLSESEQKLNDAKEKFAAAEVARNEALSSSNSTYRNDIINYYNKTKTALEEAQKAYDEEKESVYGLEEAYTGYYATIKNYEGLSAAIKENDVNAVEEWKTKLVNNFLTAENGTRESLEQQVKTFKEKYELMKDAVESGGQGVTEESVQQMKQLYEQAVKELENYGPMAAEQMNEGMGEVVSTMQSYEGLFASSGDMLNAAGVNAFISNYNDWKEAGKGNISQADAGMNEQKSVLQASTEDIAQGVLNIFNSKNFNPTGQKWIKDTAAGEQSQKSLTDKVSKDISDSSDYWLGSADTKATGSQNIGVFNSGMLSQMPNSVGISQMVSEDTKNGLGTANFFGMGNEKITDFSSGILDAADKSNEASESVSEQAKDEVGSANTRSAGQNFTSGFANGISDGTYNVIRAAGGIATTAINTVKNMLGIKSPSRVAMELGEYYDEGFGIGIKNGEDKIYDLTKSVGEIANEGLTKGLNYNNVMQESQKLIRQINSIPNPYDNVHIQYDGLIDMDRLESIMSQKKTYSFEINRRQLIRALED